MTLDKLYKKFDAIIPTASGCRNYGHSKRGYPQIVMDGERVVVTRLALERKLGRPIKPGYLACHDCDNSKCINQDHLYEGTHEDNMQDACKRQLRRTEIRKRIAEEREIGTDSDRLQTLNVCRMHQSRYFTVPKDYVRAHNLALHDDVLFTPTHTEGILTGCVLQFFKDEQPTQRVKLTFVKPRSILWEPLQAEPAP